MWLQINHSSFDTTEPNCGIDRRREIETESERKKGEKERERERER